MAAPRRADTSDGDRLKIKPGSRPWQDEDVNPGSLTEFFLASAGVAGALIGLLFVAVSVTQELLAKTDATQGHRMRASMALTAFVNALAVSLFALIPGEKLGWAAFVVAVLGLMFTVASLLALVWARRFRWRNARDVLLLVGLGATFVLQLVAGLQLIDRPDDPDPAATIAVLVVVCFLVGIARAWELIGGPRTRLGHEVRHLVQHNRGRGDAAEDEKAD